MGLAGKQRGGGTVRWRAGTVLALLALFSQVLIALLPMPVMAGDGTPICALDGTTQPATPKSDGQPGSHSPDCPVCQAAQLLGSLTPPAPAVIPVVFRVVEKAELPVVARVLLHGAASR